MSGSLRGGRSAVLLALISFGAAVSGYEKLSAGWVEHVRLFPGKVEIAAKLDTGADHSSLDARSIKKFSRQGRDWVSFRVVDRFGNAADFETPVIRTARIRRHGGKIEQRPVVSLGICMANFYLESEINLVDRRGFEYPMLIGRSFMSSRFVVDPSRTFTTEPACAVSAPGP